MTSACEIHARPSGRWRSQSLRSCFERVDLVLEQANGLPREGTLDDAVPGRVECRQLLGAEHRAGRVMFPPGDGAVGIELCLDHAPAMIARRDGERKLRCSGRQALKQLQLCARRASRDGAI